MCLQAHVSVLTGLNLAITNKNFGFGNASNTRVICTAFRES